MFHFKRDGSPATVIDGALPGVYSLGHRNPQGAALDLDGNFWAVEHGAQGGDELNRIEAGKNYGWPVIAYGKTYGGDKIGEGQRKAGLEQPVHYWDPSIAPSGLMFYSGKLFANWRGDVFTGSLKFDFISRLNPERGYHEEEIKSPETARVRDVVEAPDGSIWFLSVNNGAAYRLAPAN
jgi:glucose/arabinose dehydrogenase